MLRPALSMLIHTNQSPEFLMDMADCHRIETQLDHGAAQPSFQSAKGAAETSADEAGEKKHKFDERR